MLQSGHETRPQDIDRSVVEANHAEMQRVLAAAVELHQQGKLEQAEQLYRVLLGIDPAHADALHLLGVLANQVANHVVAVELITQAISARADVAQFHFNLGVALQNLNRNADAAHAYEDATVLDGHYREAFENLGVARQDLGQDDAAIAAYHRAIELADSSPIALGNLGTLLLRRGDVDAASQHFERAVALHPAIANAHWKMAAARLQQGNYADGWDEYEWRYCCPTFVALNPPVFAPYPKWSGTSLCDQTILITPEQGVGDEVLFASCFEDIIDRAGLCIIRCDARLESLLRRSFPRALVVAGNAALPQIPIDWRISAGSLPRFVRRDPNAFPKRMSYLVADKDETARWREWLRQRGGAFNVGISWRGGLNPRAREARSTQLSDWSALLGVEGASFFSLQYGNHAEEVEEFNAAGAAQLCMPDGLDALNDLDNLAAFISALDLVITIDNSNTHFAGALGVPTIALLPAVPEWRWREDNGCNPWFPALEMLCQESSSPGDWRPVFARARKRLEQQLRNGATRPVSRQPQSITLSREAPAPVTDSSETLLINDTSNWYHFGCTATSLAMHDRLRASGHTPSSVSIRDVLDMSALPRTIDDFSCPDHYSAFCRTNPKLMAAIDAADLIYANGEGTLHRLGHQATALLYLLHVASHHRGKKVRVVNHSCYPEGSTDVTSGALTALYQRIYHDFDYVAVRERTSAELLRSLGLEVTESFDCLPLFVEHLYQRTDTDEQPYVVIAGGVAWRTEALDALAMLVARLRAKGLGIKLLGGANAYPAGDDVGFVQALWQRCREDVEYVFATSETHWLDLIANAQLLVSGRFHHSIAAAFVGTPFIVSQSNTPKITGLLDMLKLEALVSAPPTWTHASHRKYRGDLLEKADFYLDNPGACALNREVRDELIQAGQRNFTEPSDPHETRRAGRE